MIEGKMDGPDLLVSRTVAQVRPKNFCVRGLVSGQWKCTTSTFPPFPKIVQETKKSHENI